MKSGDEGRWIRSGSVIKTGMFEWKKNIFSFQDFHALGFCNLSILGRDRTISELWYKFMCGGNGMHTPRNIPLVFVKSTELRLHLPFSDCFGIKLNSVGFQINLKIVNMIWFLLIWQESGGDFSVLNIKWCLEDVQYRDRTIRPRIICRGKFGQIGPPKVRLG